MNKRLAIALAVLGVWVPLSLFMLKQLGESYTGVFDPADRLWSLNESFSVLAKQDAEAFKQPTMIHILDKGCACYQQTASHVEYLSEQIPADVKQLYFSIEELNALGVDVPATPMTILVREGQLKYAGPYATGPLCTAQSDIILPIINGEINLSGPWLNSSAVSCRCRVNA